MDKQKTAIITGVTGQMGSYLTEFLLEKGIKVIGAVRRLSVPNIQNIGHINSSDFILDTMDLGDTHSINSIVQKYKPDFFINCAANSFVGTSWDCPEQHMEFNALGVLRQLEAIRKYSPHTRYINFGSSEEMGDVVYSPQDEKHPPRARSVYGASKISARQIVKVFRESYNLYALQCWCFNYESPRRGEEFVTRKITRGVARIYHALKNNKSFEPIELGNLESLRDWSSCQDFCSGVWMMLNQEKHNKTINFWSDKYHEYCDKNYLGQTDFGFDTTEQQERHDVLYQERLQKFLSQNIKEFVLSSGEIHSVREFVELSFKEAGILGVWNGEKENEEYILSNDGFLATKKKVVLVKINPKFYRPAEVELLHGDSTLAREELGWKPEITFPELIKAMVKNDIENYKN